MRNFSQKIISFVTAAVIALSCFGISVSAVDSLIPEGNGNMYLDVVFVLDSSGSMLESDPNRVAADAFSLFTDLCDDTCGVGYTIYSHIIKESEAITALDEKHLAELKTKISGMNRNPQGDTDIALGLDKALQLHELNNTEDDGRKKAVILLSDGNTHLIDGSKSAAQLEKEMNDVLQKLSDDGIPVYAIGLNYDGTLDKKETNKIAEKTGGKAFEAKASNELPAIIADIFANIYDIKGDSKEIKNGDVEVYIKDQSVSYVNLIIRSKLSLSQLNPVLLNPRREKIDIMNNENFVVTQTDSYILIKMLSPVSGRWKLHLDNATNENCTVSQLDFYSMYVKQSITDLNQTLVVGESTRIVASLNNESGLVTDKSLTENVSMTTTITGGGEIQTIDLTPQSNGQFIGEIILTSEGSYTIVTTATSDNFNKNSVPITLTAKTYTSEEMKAFIHNDGKVDPIELPERDPDSTGFNPVTIIIGFVVLAGIGIAVFLIFKLKDRADQSGLSLARADAHDMPEPERPAPPAPPIETIQNMPEPPKDEYIDIPIVEHGSLESLIKKGPDDAFNSSSADYQTDKSLEAIIKKGPDNDLGFGDPTMNEELNEFDNTQQETYQSGHNFSDLFGGGQNH